MCRPPLMVSKITAGLSWGFFKGRSCARSGRVNHETRPLDKKKVAGIRCTKATKPAIRIHVFPDIVFNSATHPRAPSFLPLAPCASRLALCPLHFPLCAICSALCSLRLPLRVSRDINRVTRVNIYIPFREPPGNSVFKTISVIFLLPVYHSNNGDILRVRPFGQASG